MRVLAKKVLLAYKPLSYEKKKRVLKKAKTLPVTDTHNNTKTHRNTTQRNTDKFTDIRDITNNTSSSTSPRIINETFSCLHFVKELEFSIETRIVGI